MVYNKYTSQKILKPADVVPIVSAILDTEDEIDRDKEHVYVVGLTGSHQIIFVDLVTMGLVDQAHVHPREVFRRAVNKGCSAIILCHNHPSGQLEASQDDRHVTQQIKASGEILGIELLDHIIVSNVGGYYSFAENGEL